MKKLIDLIAANEEWLMQNLLHYVVQQDYAQYTSTLLESWRMSIAGLSQPMIAELQAGRLVVELTPHYDYSQDPVSYFGVIEAQRHRERGINLTMFLSLMKYYRRTFQDLLTLGDLTADETAVAQTFIINVFDRVELGFVAEWRLHNGDARVQELQVANRAMTNEKNKYLTIFESLSDPVVLLNENGRVDLINAAAAKLFQSEQDRYYKYKTPTHESTLDPLIGSNITLSIPWLQPELSQFLVGNQDTLQVEKPIFTGQQTGYYAIKYSRMLDISQKFSGVLITFLDVTRRRLAEMQAWMSRDAAESANRAKTTFLANMSHELRTPLNAMLGFVQLIENSDVLPPTQAENLDIVQQSGVHLLALIDQILDLAKVEAGKMEAEETAFDLHKMLHRVGNLFSVRFAEKNLKFYDKLAADVPQFVRGDELKLRQILTNILGNAVKFTDEGSITLLVQRVGNDSAQDTNVVHLHFEVADTGIGIPADDLTKIFKAFVQAQAGQARPGGTGLGMAISSQFVQLLGGELRVASVVGEGTRFWFSIPLTVIEQLPPEQLRPQPRPLPLPATAPTYRILVVDDQPFNRLLVVKLLEPLGFAMREAANGQEAVDIWHEWRPHLVFMDMRMPVMDGYQASQLIKQKSNGDTAVIAMTASVIETDKSIRAKAGVDGMLGKPFQQSELYALLETHLDIDLIRPSASQQP